MNCVGDFIITSITTCIYITSTIYNSLPTVTPASFQDVCVRFSVIDQDRHCGPVEIGSTSVTLKVMIMFKMMIMVLVVMIYPQEAKQTGPDPDKFSSSQILSPPKKVKSILKPPEISSPSKSHHHCAFSENMQRKVSIKSHHIWLNRWIYSYCKYYSIF